ncbi:MAG TPA: glycosyltransferase [Thermoplasmata archaeon]|nr:glycosyltransferase [Thermoplasmata archaeon]
MEIAFFTDSFLPTRDGVAIEVASLARAVRSLGHDVTVFAPDPGGPRAGRPPEPDGLAVVRTRSVPVPLYSGYRWAVFPFARLARGAGRRFDVAHLHTPGLLGMAGFLAARAWRKPLVGTFHTNVGAMRDAFRERWSADVFLRVAWIWSLGTYWRCDLTTAPTLAARRALETHARKPFRRPIEVVPNGIEVDRFHPGVRVPDWRARCGLPDGPIVTYLGRLTQDKGVHRFLSALAEAGDRPFAGIVAGAGPEEAAVRHRLATDPALMGRVRFVGPVTEEEKPALLAQTDVFVLPSTSDTSSVALLEAMASGVACLASDDGGPADLIDDGSTGRLAPVRTDGPLGRALGELLDDPGGRARLGSAARARVVATGSIVATARRFISLYEHLLAGGGDGAAGHAR